jgi:putative ABC transport system permease protein
MVLFIKLFKESVFFALGSVLGNKMRTVLTLLGITIGIFCIISVFSVVDALERQVRNSIESLGDNVVYIQKWPWTMSGDMPWWRYVGRPVPRMSELDELLRRNQTLEAAAFVAATSLTVEHMNTSAEEVTIIGVSEQYNRVRVLDIQDGRYFSPSESAAGSSVAILGFDLAKNLFGESDPLNKQVKFFGRKVTVIGVFAKEGMNTFGNSHDETVIVPIRFLQYFIDVNAERYNPFIMAQALPGVSNEEMIDDLTVVMRSIRRLKPLAEDTFALNETSLLSQGFDGLFAIIKMAGWIIGGFSILVGGFGIANIMFVSVRERTSIIGIQKALGAKNYFILLQFLCEAVVLSFLGGLIGLLLVMTGALLISSLFDMEFALTTGNILLGINVSVIIGLVSGFVPAWSASRLNPVDAIRSTG